MQNSKWLPWHNYSVQMCLPPNCFSSLCGWSSCMHSSVSPASPRDFKVSPTARPAPILIRTDARYKGYPGNSFHSPRIPISHSPDLVKEKTPRDFFGKLTLFDPGRPKLDEGHRGLQYGSGNIHLPPPAPKPTQHPPSVRAVPFGENKTPAEIERRRELQREAEEDIQRFRAEQARRKEREMAEKKKDYDQLKYHFMLDPHKYGHGAPRGDGDHKRKKFTEEAMAPQSSARYKDPSYGIPHRQLTKPLNYDIEADENRHPDFFLNQLDRNKSEAHSNPAPNHMLRGDKIIRFQDEGRKSIENTFRYNKPQQEKEEFRRDLERQKEDMELLKQREKIRELRQELEMLKSEEKTQTGGGAPNRSSSEEYMKRQEQSQDLKSLELGQGQGGAGAPIVDSRGSKVTRHPITMERNDMGVSSIKENVPGQRRTWNHEEEDYNAFGRPGAGAPMRDKDGRIVTAIYGNLGRDGVVQLSSAERRRRTRAAKVYNDDLQKEIEEQRRIRKDTEEYVKAPVGELATIMMEGKVGKPQRDHVTGNLKKAALGTTDVSRIKMNKPEDSNRTDMRQYYNDLTMQAQERHNAQKLDKLREGQEWRQHNDTFWFSPDKKRFGGGAPKANNLKKERLSNLLYSPRRDEKSYQSEGNEQYSSSNIGQRYVKSTIPSSNRNMYELPQDGSSNPYNLRAPFALGNY